MSATLAAVDAGAVVPDTLHAVTVGGRSEISIRPGGTALSDLVPWTVDPESRQMAVSLAIRAGSTDATENIDAQQRNLVAYGDRVWQRSDRAFQPVTTWPWVSDVEVRRPAPSHTVVASVTRSRAVWARASRGTIVGRTAWRTASTPDPTTAFRL